MEDCRFKLNLYLEKKRECEKNKYKYYGGKLDCVDQMNEKCSGATTPLFRYKKCQKESNLLYSQIESCLDSKK
jgi:hypothetical protein